VDYCNTIGLPVIPKELRTPFNLIDIATEMKRDIDEVSEEGQHIRFNIAGGTRLMSSAALLVCILKGIPTTYVHDDTSEEIQLPLLQMDYSSAFTSKQREILNYLSERGDAPLSQTKLAGAVGIHKATMNHHIKELKKKGAIEISSHEKDGRVSMISLAPHMHLLLE